MKLMKHPSLTNPEGRKLLGQDACCARPLLVRCTKTVPLPQTDRQPGRQAQTETETERERDVHMAMQTSKVYRHFDMLEC